jgi:hypothetical protein
MIRANSNAGSEPPMPKGVCRFDRDVDVGQGERTPSATEALRLVREHMKLRRQGVRIEDERGK